MAKPTPFFSFTCPSCGAPGAAYSATSVLLVCEYCHSMLERFGGGLESTGKKSILLEDFSPIQLYTSGTYQGDPFTVIGVLQIQYERGFWKEWYILFADGTGGWLGDFSGQYAITRKTQNLKTIPSFDNIRAGKTVIAVGKSNFMACDVREATSLKTYARGELPFTLKDNEKVLSVDFRYRNLFITLDYSEDAKNPLVYQGKMIELENLRCQNLRTDDEIKATAGRLKGERASLNCPQCGAPLAWYPGVASNIICQNCQSHINFDSGLADLTKTHKRRLAQQEISTLKLGDMARILGEKWTIIGMARIHELPPVSTLMHLQGEKTKKMYEDSYWHEYLLYNVKKGFFWLVESSDGSWDQSHPPHTWPELQGERCIDSATNKPLRRLYDYGGEVIYAAGAFYWNIEPGDITYYQDFQLDNGKISAELTREELNWSLSKPVTGEELATWFKRPELAQAVSNQSSEHPNLFLGWVMFGIYALINLPILFANEEIGFVTLITSYIVYWLVLGRYFKKDDDDDD